MSAAPDWRSADEFGGRRAALIDRLAERGIDGAVVVGDAGRTWLSGFDAASDDVVPPGAVLVGRNVERLMTPTNNVGWAASLAPGIETVAWPRPNWSTLARALAETGWRRVAYEPDRLSVRAFDVLRGEATGMDLVDIGDSLDRLRAVKSTAELAAIRRAVELTDQAFVVGTRDLTAGVTERELAWRIERAMRDVGADGTAFPTIVAAGRHAARPHHAPTDRAIQPGEPVVIDMGARWRAYRGDLTRTVWVGEPDPRLTEIYAIVAAANLAAQAATWAGATGRQVDAAGRDVIAAAGYGEAFTHGLGHGVGLEIHEAPSASTRSEDTLVAGQTLTIEPGIYLPDWGGVRIEDVVIVTDDGCDLYSHAPK